MKAPSCTHSFFNPHTKIYTYTQQIHTAWVKTGVRKLKNSLRKQDNTQCISISKPLQQWLGQTGLSECSRQAGGQVLILQISIACWAKRMYIHTRLSLSCTLNRSFSNRFNPKTVNFTLAQLWALPELVPYTARTNNLLFIIRVTDKSITFYPVNFPPLLSTSQ